MKQNFPKSEKNRSTRSGAAGNGGGSSVFPGGRQGFGDEGLTEGGLPQAGKLRLLSLLLAAPEEGSLSLVEELAQEHFWLLEPVEELAGISLGDWQAEHTRLFVSGYPKTACPPFESAYRRGNVGGVAAEELGALYQSLGLATDGVSSDYLGTILECAAYLLEAPQSPTGSLWDRVWQDHIVGWVPRFARDLQANSRLMIYRRLAEHLLECVRDGA